MFRCRRRTVVIGTVLLLLYVNSYFALSRRGFEEARAGNAKGFYFFTPENTDLWRYMNYGCVSLYEPLIVVENWLGTGMPPGCEPMWGLSK